MLSVTYRKFGIKLTHVYFATNEEIISGKIYEKTSDVIFLHGVKNITPRNGTLLTIQNTLMKNLVKTEDELFQTLGKHLRAYINRSIREGSVIKIFNGKECAKDKNLMGVIAFLFEKMYTDKGIKSSFNRKLAELFAEKEALSVGIAYANNNPVGFDACIYDENNARLWLSAFNFRNADCDSQVLSRAHQQLDWKMLLWCKEQGINAFDFGGVNSFENPNGIAKFKMEFEKEGKVTYNNYLIPNSILGNFALFLYKLKQKFLR